MFFKAAVLLSALTVAVAQVTVNTPASLTTCVPVQLSWSATTGPYYLSVLPGGQAGATPLAQLGTFTTTSYTWTVNIAAGTAVTITVTDASGTPNYSDQVTIMAGTSTACVGQTAATGAAAGGTAAAGTAVAATAAGGTSAGSAISSAVAAATTTAAAPAATTTRATSTSAAPATTTARTTSAAGASTTGAAPKVVAGSAFGLAAAVLAVAMA